MPRGQATATVGSATEDTAENNAVADLTERAMRLLAAREHSVAELRRKLRSGRTPGGAGKRVRGKGCDDALESVLDTLQRGGLLSDVRFAEAFVHSRVERGQGPAKIRAGLRERGVARELVDDALDFEPDFWRERAVRAHAKRFGEAPPADRAEWAKRARFLAARGFAAEIVYRTLGEQPV